MKKLGESTQIVQVNKRCIDAPRLTGLPEANQISGKVEKAGGKMIVHQIEIRVQDKGWGIPDSVKDKTFQFFFIIKPTDQGTGLGLSLAYEMITKGHEGKLEVENKEGEAQII